MPGTIPAAFTVAPLHGPLLAQREDETQRRALRVYLWIATAMAASYIFESPLRFVLLKAHLPVLIYLRDLAAVGSIGFAAFSWMTGERRLFPLIIALYA